jgi:hypothetical protein
MGGTFSSKKHQGDLGCVKDGSEAKTSSRSRRKLQVNEENLPVPDDNSSIQEPDFKLESSEEVTRSCMRKQHTKFHRSSHFEIPDYSKIPAKVDCWRK